MDSKKAAMIAGAAACFVFWGRHRFKFHSHFPPSPVLSMLLKSLLSSFPAGTSFGSCATALGLAPLQGTPMIKKKNIWRVT